MQEEDWKTLTSDIHAKCVTYDYSDMGDYTLSEYITNLLQTGNDPAVINSELQQLVGSDYDTNLTAWMFARREELEKAHNPPAAAPVQSTAASPSSTLPDMPASINTPKAQQNRIFAQAIGGVSRSSVGQPSAAPRRHVERSRSRSPEKRGRQRERSPEHSESPSSNIMSRLGTQNGRQVSIVSGGRSSVFDRLGGTRPTASPNKERCKFWPSCHQGEQCPFFHPKTICPDFPNCPKSASECMFIHPEVNPPQAQHQQQRQRQAQMMAAGAVSKKSFPCKFYPNCTNPACPFIHPDQVPMGYMPIGGRPFIPQQQQPMATNRVPILCKNGENCKRPGCHFLHPGDENPTDIVCKYDGICTRPNCFYKHLKPHPAPHAGGNRSLVLTNKKDVSERQFSVADDDIVEHIVVGESADLIRPTNGTAQKQQDDSSSAVATAANA